MKNFILILSIIIFKSSTLIGQENISLGAKGGINLSNMSSDYFADSNFRTGFHLGLFAEIPLGERFSFQPELLYGTQGAKADRKMDGSGPRTTEYKLDYLQIPVLAKIFLTESLSIEAGPSFNFLVNEKTDGQETDFGRNFEFAGALGASYKFGYNFFGNLRYTYGFTSAFNKEFSDNSERNNGFQLGVGFAF